jgi:ArsR family transcriptional regulator
MHDDIEDLARRLQAVSVVTRIKILGLLKDRALCVGAIVARLNVTQGAVSQHLRVLREAGYVEADRRGCRVHYRLRPAALGECKQALDRILRCQRDKQPFVKKGAQPCPRKAKVVRSQRS